MGTCVSLNENATKDAKKTGDTEMCRILLFIISAKYVCVEGTFDSNLVFSRVYQTSLLTQLE